MSHDESDNTEGGSRDPPFPPGLGDGSGAIEPEVITPDNTSSLSDGSPFETSGSGTVPVSEINEDWAEFFPFDEPYADQVDGINAFVDALTSNEFMLMEGACGTGKTLVGLTAGLHHLRNHDRINATQSSDVPEYDRVLAATPVKQQLKQFIEEMRTINQNLNSTAPFSTVVMRGQRDVLPYAFTDHPPFDEYSVGERMDDLRELTYHVIKFDSNVPLNWPADMEPPYWSRYDYDWSNPDETASGMRDQYKLDPNRAEAVVKILNNRVENGEDPLVVNGVTAPFPDEVPHTNQLADQDELARTNTGQLPMDLQGKFDPFYAGFFADDRLPFWFTDADDLVMDAESLFELGVSNGICPHQAMAEMMQFADVLIGNYYHVFDPQTRLLTDMKTKVLDSGTICILDEAHNIEEKVRDILSDAKGVYSLRQSVNDIRAAIGYLTANKAKLPQSELSNVKSGDMNAAMASAEDVFNSPTHSSLSRDDFENAIDFLQFLQGNLLDTGESHLNERFNKGWEYVVDQKRHWMSTEDIPLGDPENDSPDDLSTTVTNSTDFDEDIWKDTYAAGRAAGDIIDAVEMSERQPISADTGRFFYRWANESRIDYFREVVLDLTYREYPIDETHQWTTEWSPRYQLYNCIPTVKLREIFSELGAGMLMSATLEPIDELISTTGVSELVHPKSVEDADERAAMIRSGAADKNDDVEFRDVTVRRYPLRFPRENRMSTTVPATKFTYGNRGDKETRWSDMSETRETYADLLLTIAQSHGNILICLPSYGEASWAKKVLDDADGLSKRVIIDQSSSSAETDETLSDFFDADYGVILTSTRGTITEGVDFDGDKLHCCAVMGVSLLPPKDRNKAVENAYDEHLTGISGFDATSKIPAARKARQAIGRVIRGAEEVGVRLFVDARYLSSGWGGVNQYLSGQEQHEFNSTRPEALQHTLQMFWEENL
jgi:DNA excision repair protein ERCC-2